MNANANPMLCDVETGLFIANERAWTADWMRDFRAGKYTPWPEYCAKRLNHAIAQEIDDRAGHGLPILADFDFPRFDGDHGCWIVEEQLMPENRGTLCHRFMTYADARAFYKSKV